jgi:hypothetical protein
MKSFCGKNGDSQEKFFITAESAEIAEKKRYNKKQKTSLRSPRALR